jgi:hypothetical protein
MVKRGSWLSLTPEPERELPRLIATLAQGYPPPEEAVVAEEVRVRRLVLRGGELAWFRYLHHVIDLLEAPADIDDPEVASARARTIKVLVNHHNLVLGLPGRAAQRTAEDRARLEALAAGRPRQPTPT